jgi:hypothetical protein
MTVEYKEFTVHQSLKALQRLEPEECKAGTTEKGKAATPPASPKNNGKERKKPD